MGVTRGLFRAKHWSINKKAEALHLFLLNCMFNHI